MSLKNKIKNYFFQFTYPSILHPTYVLRIKNKKKIFLLFFGFLPISRLILISQTFTKKYWERINNVGTLDEHFVLLNIDLDPKHTILDIGCANSSISLGLASFGYDVVGIDFRNPGYSHKNFTFLKKNFFDIDLQGKLFDCILAVSVLEHIGMGHYGDQSVKNGDTLAMKKIYSLLKPNGVLFISVPGGKQMIYEKNGIQYIRIFEPENIEKLCEKFVIEKELFFKKINQDWIQCTSEELKQLAYVDEDIGAILIKARKK